MSKTFYDAQMNNKFINVSNYYTKQIVKSSG